VSSHSYFTLIRGDAVVKADGRKIIPAATFSQLLDSQQLLTAVHDDAEAYKLDVVADCEKLKIEAQQIGFQEGFEQWAAAIATLEAEIANVRGELEKSIIPVALAAAKKIVGREIAHSDAIVDIVASNLKAVSQHKQIAIYVSRKDLEILEANRPRLRQLFEGLETLSIRERDDISAGGCIIETEGGIINARLENQWRSLEKAFDRLLKKPTTNPKGTQ
jgi:type III secretion protein L